MFVDRRKHRALEISGIAMEKWLEFASYCHGFYLESYASENIKPDNIIILILFAFLATNFIGV